MKRLTVFAVCLFLAGCVGWPSNWRSERSTGIVARVAAPFERARHDREACQQALDNGWCGGVYEDCKEKPPQCCPPKNVRCSPDGFCVWEGCDGALVFGFGGFR